MPFALSLAALLVPSPYFKIRVVDAETGRGLPLVELRTVNELRFITDSAGLVAFQEPGLMSGDVYFHVRSHGYEMKADGFGYRGVVLKPRAGGEATIRLPRINVAERVARLTGAGIYRDSELLAERIPLKRPGLNGGVLGQDTAQAESYRGKMMWFWGDTNRASYPLGNFHTSGAIATLPSGGPDRGIEFDYLTGPDGFVRPMIESKASNPIWLGGLVVLGQGTEETLYAHYAQMQGLGKVIESGLLRWNDAARRFDIVQRFSEDRGWRFLDGHTVQHQGFVYGNAPATVRVRADAKSLLDAAEYEVFTCLGEDGQVRRKDGRPEYRWQKALPPLDSETEGRLVGEGQLRPEEAWFRPRLATGEAITVVAGSVHWNAYRKRWVAIFGRKGGRESFLGEIEYAEADAPNGPFHRAVKVVIHDRYTFYNPVHHAFLDRGSAIYFEGTYTSEFSGNEEKTPLYDYNQILYKLDLAAPGLAFAREEPVR